MSYSSVLEHDALTETYNDVRLLIYKRVHHWAAISGMAFDDLLGEAHFIFARTFRDYKPEKFKAKFSSFLYFCLDCGLQTYIKKQHKHRNLEEVSEADCGTEDHNAFLLEIHSALSDDAKIVVNLLLTTPDDIAVLFRWHRVKSRRGVMLALREHLMDIGWDPRQIRATFDELKTVINRS